MGDHQRRQQTQQQKDHDQHPPNQERERLICPPPAGWLATGSSDFLLHGMAWTCTPLRIDSAIKETPNAFHPITLFKAIIGARLDHTIAFARVHIALLLLSSLVSHFALLYCNLLNKDQPLSPRTKAVLSSPPARFSLSPQPGSRTLFPETFIPLRFSAFVSLGGQRAGLRRGTGIRGTIFGVANRCVNDMPSRRTRPSTPSMMLGPLGGPNSPPHSPTSAAPAMLQHKYAARHLPPSGIQPTGNGHQFSFTPSNRFAQLSPRTSSEDSDEESESESDSDESELPQAPQAKSEDEEDDSDDEESEDDSDDDADDEDEDVPMMAPPPPALMSAPMRAPIRAPSRPPMHQSMAVDSSSEEESDDEEDAEDEEGDDEESEEDSESSDSDSEMLPHAPEAPPIPR
ncbi:hypothetical protein CCHR01_09259, partial [Colletotrichum chrysophilum]